MTNDFKRAFKATPATAGLVTVMVLVYLWKSYKRIALPLTHKCYFILVRNFHRLFTNYTSGGV